MRKWGTFAVVGLVVVAAIVASILVPVTRPADHMISLPISRMLACPIGDPNLPADNPGRGKTVVTVTDQENFVAGELNALPSDPMTNFQLENPTKAVIVRGSATVAGVSTYTNKANDHEMVVPCAPPVTTGSWNGVSVKDGSTLILTNVDAGAAKVDIFLYGQLGPIATPGLRDIPVGSGTTITRSIDTNLVSTDTVVSVQIRASKGRVAAVLRTIGDHDQGFDWALPQTSPDTDLLMAGIPAGDGIRTLSIANTDPTNKAQISVEVMGESGSFAPLGLETIEIAPSRTTSVDITQALGGQASAIHLVSDRPVTATVVINGTPSSETETTEEENSETQSTSGDIAGISAQPPLNGAVVFPGVGGTLWAANPSDQTATLTMDSKDDSGAASTESFDVAPHMILSIPFPSSGTVKLTTDSSVVRTSLVLDSLSLSILPISGGGVVASVPVPHVVPGLG